MLSTHSKAQELAKITKSNSIYYNVIVGPYDPGLCGQMNQIVLIPYLDCMKPRITFVYHINFQCPFRQITYQSQLLPSTTPYCYNTSQYYEDFTNVGSLYVGANKYQITTALTKILRHLNRLNIVLIYQDDDHVTDASGIFANYVAYLLIQRKEFGISVKEINGWHLGKDVSNVFPVGGVNISEPCVSLIDDLLSLHIHCTERLFSNEINFGYGNKQFKHHVQQQQQRTSQVQGEDGFYASLKNTTLKIPVRSDLSVAVTFNEYPETSQAALDFHLITTYTCSENTVNATVENVTTCLQVYSTMTWPDYNVSSTLLGNSWQLAAILQQSADITECVPNNGIVMALIFMSVLTAVIAFSLIAFFLARCYRRRKMYREGPNKLIIYPDDVVFMKTHRTVKHATPSNVDLRFPTLTSETKINGSTASHPNHGKVDNQTKSLVSVMSGDGIEDTNVARYNVSGHFIYIHMSLNELS
ncbi:unnamed protein product [Heterobilharzia americana]|nr:unnamed protein product [Heterobilharzia americana]